MNKKYILVLLSIVALGCVSRRKMENTINYFPWIESDKTCAIDLVKGYGKPPEDSLISRVGFRSGNLDTGFGSDIHLWFVYHRNHLIILTDTLDWKNKIQNYFGSKYW